MGQGHGGGPQGVQAPNRVEAGDLSEAEFSYLQDALGVAENALTAVVELPSFLACFPSHLRPLVQPLFFLLSRSDSDIDAQGSFGPEPDAPLPQLVHGVSRLVHDGASWAMILEAWGGSSSSTSPAEVRSAGERAKAGAELGLALCYWCAHANLVPEPGAPGGCPSSAVAAAVHGTDPDLVESILTSFWPLDAEEVEHLIGSPDRVKARLQECLPCLPKSIGPRFAQALLGRPLEIEWPAIDTRILDSGLEFLLRGIDTRLWDSGTWESLYCDWRDGRAFSSFLKGVLHYPGLAVLLIRLSRSHSVLGGMSSTWEEGRGKFTGASDNTLFALRPCLQVLRTSGRGSNYFYLNSRNKHAPRGIGFGGQAECSRLWVDANFEECQVLQSDATYKPGMLLAGSKEFQEKERIAAIEVWGCAGAEALRRQLELREKEEGIRQSERKVDRSKFMENQFDREMFFGKTFAHSEDKAADT
mmetsp:Transcript_53078/g.98188  ORF Transcript_53078/g.98188 Transcript_53078/m.98188 type:complete len:473 (-) Transcript_53078:142-1560(-)